MNILSTWKKQTNKQKRKPQIKRLPTLKLNVCNLGKKKKQNLFILHKPQSLTALQRWKQNLIILVFAVIAQRQQKALKIFPPFCRLSLARAGHPKHSVETMTDVGQCRRALRMTNTGPCSMITSRCSQGLWPPAV